MIKYILHGGNSDNKSEKNILFYREIIIGLAEPVNILMVYFAREELEWQEKLKIDKDIFISANPGKNMDFVIASRDRETFEEQIRKSQVVFFSGGNTEILLNQLRSMNFIEGMFERKVLVGTSAGACILAEYYLDEGSEVGKGLGLLPIKIMVHYNDDRAVDLKTLERAHGNLRNYYIREEEYIIFEEEETEDA